MKKNNPVSVYVERRFPLENKGLIEEFFEQANNFPGANWVPFTNSRRRGYKQGKQVSLTFDYKSDSLEAKVFLEENGSEVVISIGNSGFPFEPMMAKSRYEEIANKLEQYIQSNDAEQGAPPDAYGAGEL